MIKAKARQEALFTEQIGNELIIYDRKNNRAHRLNQTSVLVWQNCDGTKTVADIVQILKKELNEMADENLVIVSLGQLQSASLLQEPIQLTPQIARASRREFVRKVGAVGIMTVLLPLLTTISIPTPAQAQTCGSSIAEDQLGNPMADQADADGDGVIEGQYEDAPPGQ